MNILKVVSIFIAAITFVISANHAQAKISDIGVKSVVFIKNYCTARGSGGRDGDGTGRYVAPTGYTIEKAEVSLSKHLTSPKRPCKRCSITRTKYTQPGFVSLYQSSKVQYSKSLGEMAASLKDPIAGLKLKTVSSIIDNLRVINTTTHAEVVDKCHGESHRRPLGNSNGWGYYDLKVTLKREALSNDFVGAVLEIIKATETGDTKRFYKVVDLLNQKVN